MRRTVLLALIALAATAADAAPGAAADVVIQRGGKAALRVALPSGWTAIPQGDATILNSPTGAPHVELSPTAAVSVDAAVTDAPKLFMEYVTDFTPATTADATVAGAPAKVLSGTGAEADDGDPSNAEVTFFAVDGVVWALTAHGEGQGVAKAHAALDGLRAAIVAAKP